MISQIDKTSLTAASSSDLDQAEPFSLVLHTRERYIHQRLVMHQLTPAQQTSVSGVARGIGRVIVLRLA